MLSKGILKYAHFDRASELCEFWNSIDQELFHIHSIVPTPPGYTLFYVEHQEVSA